MCLSDKKTRKKTKKLMNIEQAFYDLSTKEQKAVLSSLLFTLDIDVSLSVFNKVILADTGLKLKRKKEF